MSVDKALEDMGACTVIVKDGKHMIRTPKGEIIQGLIFTRVHDEVDEFPTVLVKMFCRLEQL